jgi:D-3-phosphoglycerate dehydrogenase
VRFADSPSEVAAACDILSVHVALTPETRGLVNSDVFARLKPGAFVVNTARAEVMDYDALEAAVRDKQLRVGLDVFRNEPAGGTGEYRDSLLALPDVYGTHHIGASTEQAQEAIAAETVRIVTAFKQTGKVPNCVNLAGRTPATHLLVVRHRDRPGVLAHVFDQLREASINVQETENVIFEGAHAAVARINLDREPDAGVLGRIEGHADVLRVQVVAL